MPIGNPLTTLADASVSAVPNPTICCLGMPTFTAIVEPPAGGDAVNGNLLETYHQKFEAASQALSEGLADNRQKNLFKQHSEAFGLHLRQCG